MIRGAPQRGRQGPRGDLRELVLESASIGGLVSFWVALRTRSIGARRALGDRCRNIYAYFQLENLWIVGSAVLLGMMGADLLNLRLMVFYEIAALPRE